MTNKGDADGAGPKYSKREQPVQQWIPCLLNQLGAGGAALNQSEADETSNPTEDDRVCTCVCVWRYTEAEQLFRSFCIPVGAKLGVSLVFHSPVEQVHVCQTRALQHPHC